jgi:hypothetical protein
VTAGTRRLLVAGAAGLVVASSVTMMPPTAGATLVFTASSAASGVRISETVAGSPGAETLVDGGGPTAQALLTSGATSTGFASFPYPGDTAVSLPGQLAGLAPQVPRLPDYPFYVRADQTNPEPPPVETPLATLEAKAGPSESTSTAATGAGGTEDGVTVDRLEALARSVNGEHSVTATATGRASGVAMGPLRIASIESVAGVVLDATGSLQRTSRLRVDGLTVDGQGLAIENGNIVLAAGKVALPDTGPVRKALAAAGLDLEYVARQDTATGLVSEGIAVRRTQETPNGPVTVRFAFGQAAASIDGSLAPDLAVPDLGGGGAVDLPPAIAPGPSPAVPSPVPASAGSLFAPPSDPALDGSQATPAGASVGSLSELSGPDGAGVGLPSDVPAGAPPQLAAAPALRAAPFFDVATSYLAIVAAGAVALAFAVLVSLMGVRFGWKH